MRITFKGNWYNTQQGRHRLSWNVLVDGEHLGHVTLLGIAKLNRQQRIWLRPAVNARFVCVMIFVEPLIEDELKKITKNMIRLGMHKEQASK